MPRNGYPHNRKVKIPRHETFQPSQMQETRCRETRHLVPTPIGEPLIGTYTLFEADGTTIHKGNLADLSDAETADSTTDSEDA